MRLACDVRSCSPQLDTSTDALSKMAAAQALQQSYNHLPRLKLVNSISDFLPCNIWDAFPQVFQCVQAAFLEEYCRMDLGVEVSTQQGIQCQSMAVDLEEGCSTSRLIYIM